jgi:hypothetical protein
VYLFDGSDFVAAPGDATHDGTVDGLDYSRWAAHVAPPDLPEGLPPEFDSGPLTPDKFVRGPADGDFNFDGRADGLDYLIWVANYGPADDVLTPEPATLALICGGMLIGLFSRRRRHSARPQCAQPLREGA